jgi:hypothetical protein
MSGRAEVADLLKRLSDNTIGIAEAAAKARQIQAQQAAVQQAAPPTPTPTPTPTSTPTTLSQPAKDAHDDIQVIRNTPELSKEEKQEKVKDRIEQLTKPPAKQQPSTTPAPKPRPIEIMFHCSHEKSGQPLEGTFEVWISGGATEENASFSTSGGVGKCEVPLKAGVYTIILNGKRTQFPMAVPNKLSIPEFHQHPAFDIRLSGHVSPQEIPLSGNSQLTVSPTASRLIVRVVAREDSTTEAIWLDYAHEQGVDMQGEFAVGAALKGVELGSVKFGGTSVDHGTNSTKYTFNVAYTFLTGGLTITQGTP